MTLAAEWDIKTSTYSKQGEDPSDQVLPVPSYEGSSVGAI